MWQRAIALEQRLFLAASAQNSTYVSCTKLATNDGNALDKRLFDKSRKASPADALKSGTLPVRLFSGAEKDLHIQQRDVHQLYTFTTLHTLQRPRRCCLLTYVSAANTDIEDGKVPVSLLLPNDSSLSKHSTAQQHTRQQEHTRQRQEMLANA